MKKQVKPVLVPMSKTGWNADDILKHRVENRMTLASMTRFDNSIEWQPHQLNILDDNNNIIASYPKVNTLPISKSFLEMFVKMPDAKVWVEVAHVLDFDIDISLPIKNRDGNIVLALENEEVKEEPELDVRQLAWREFRNLPQIEQDQPYAWHWWKRAYDSAAHNLKEQHLKH